MNVTEYRTYVVTEIISHELVSIKSKLSFSNVEYPILDMHAMTNARFSISETITEWTKRKAKSNQATAVEDRPIQLIINISPLIDGIRTSKKYDITTKINSEYESKFDLMNLLDLNGESLSQLRSSNKSVVFDDTENCELIVQTKNLLNLQISKISILLRSTKQVNWIESTNV